MLKSMDVKLGVAMTAMLKASGDQGADLYLDVNRKANQYVQTICGKIIKGRQIIAMMYESFRTCDRLDMMVALAYLIKLQYPTAFGPKRTLPQCDEPQRGVIGRRTRACIGNAYACYEASRT